MKHSCSAFALLFVALAAGFGCHPPPAKHYALQGEVISTDAQKKLITVKHGEIPGLMPAMTMQYMVADPKQLESLQPGDKITADLVVSEGRGDLEKIVVVGKAPSGATPPKSQ